MKISKTQLMICLLFLCCTNFFMNGSYIFGIYYLDIICMMLFIWIMLGVVINKFVIPTGEMKGSLFCYPILAFWSLTIIEIIYSYIRYKQSIQSVFKMSYFYLVLAVYFVLIVFLDSKKKLDTFKQMLVIFCTLCNVYQIIYFVLYSTAWNPYFYLTLLTFPISISYIAKGICKKLTWLNVITTVLCVFFVGNNTAIRIAFVIVSVCVVIANFITNAKDGSNKMIIKLIVFIVVAVGGLGGFFGNYITNIINSGVGNQVRVYAMEYYWEKFLESPILGMGIIDPTVSDELYTLLHGDISALGGIGQYYLEDVGVVGYIAQFGALGMFVLIWLLIKIYKAVKQASGRFFIENVGFFVLLFAMFISLMPTNKAPIQMLPMFLAMVEKNAQFSNETTSN